MIPSPGKRVLVLASNKRARDIPIGSIGYISHTYQNNTIPLNKYQTQHLKEYGAFTAYHLSSPKVKQFMDVVFSRIGRNKQCIKRKTVVNIMPDFKTATNMKNVKTFLKSVNTLRSGTPERNIVVLCDIDTPMSMDEMPFNDLASLLYSLILFVTQDEVFRRLDREYTHGMGMSVEHADSVIDRVETKSIIFKKKTWKLLRSLTRNFGEGELYKRALYKEHMLPTIFTLRTIIGQLQKAYIQKKIASNSNLVYGGDGLIYDMYFLPEEIRSYLRTIVVSFGSLKVYKSKVKQMDEVKKLLRSLSPE